MSYTTLRRGDDGPDPVGFFETYEEAQAYAKWAADDDGGQYEVIPIANVSALFPGPDDEEQKEPIRCLTCGHTEFEKRGTRRTYHPLGPDLEDDGWNEGDVEMDYDDDGEEIIYCIECGSEFTEDELRTGKVIPASEWQPYADGPADAEGILRAERSDV